MLDVGRERAGSTRSRSISASRPTPKKPTPFAADSFDAYTIAFGIRNVPRIEGRARRGAPRPEDQRPLSLPAGLPKTTCRSSTVPTGMVVQRDPAISQAIAGASGPTPLPRRVDPKCRTRRASRSDGEGGELRPGDLAQLLGRHRGAAFGLEALTRPKALARQEHRRRLPLVRASWIRRSQGVVATPGDQLIGPPKLAWRIARLLAAERTAAGAQRARLARRHHAARPS